MFGIVLAPFCLSPCDRKVANGHIHVAYWRWKATVLAMERYCGGDEAL